MRRNLSGVERVGYLSDAWIAAMDEQLRAHAPLGATDGGAASGLDTLQIRIRTIVSGGPDGERGYEISLGHGTDGVRLLPTDDADPHPGASPDATTITFRTDIATATGIASGAQGAQAAFMAGRLRVEGDTRLLMAHQDVLRALDDVFAPLRASTDFDPAAGS
jgi:putative sterol carrier protein